MASPSDTIHSSINENQNKSLVEYKSALRTNLLADAVAIPNIGVEFSLRSRWSLGADVYYADWHSTSPTRYWRCQGAEISLSKNLASRRHLFFNNCFLSIYTQIMRFNILISQTGYLSGHSGARFFDRPTIGAGFAIGYKFHIANHIRLDLTLGAGFQSGQYQTYRIIDAHRVWQSTRTRRFLGPTKAAVTLVYQFGKGSIL